MKYPKIQTLWKRDPNNKHRIIEGDYSKPEFKNIKKWDVTEKIDGMNIRIVYDGDKTEFGGGVVAGTVRFGGRTDNAQIPARLFEYLQQTFTPDKMGAVFENVGRVILFGEGYGAKIQRGGGLYRSDNAFILFDVLVDQWWLSWSSIEDISAELWIEHVPWLGEMSSDEIVALVKSRPLSTVSDEERPAEGIVARASPMVLYRDGTPLMWKLKVKDYVDVAKS